MVGEGVSAVVAVGVGVFVGVEVLVGLTKGLEVCVAAWVVADFLVAVGLRIMTGEVGV